MRDKSSSEPSSHKVKALEADGDNPEVRERIFEWFKRLEYSAKSAYENKDIREYKNQIEDAVFASPLITAK
jgi:hypothetical protein